jgi:hypothetical protein
MDCGYCHKHFINNRTLSTHQATAKYCLEIQGMDSHANYICITCEQSFSREDSCNRHMIACTNTKPGQVIGKLRTDNDKLRTDTDAMVEKLRNDNDKLRIDNDKLRTDNDAIVEKLRTDNDAIVEKLRIDNDKLRTDNDAIVEKLRTDDALVEKLRSDNYSKEGMIALMQDKIDRQEAKNISMEKSLIDMNVLQAKVEIYKSQSMEDRECIKQIAKQPKMITTTTNILNMHTLDLSDDRVKNIVDQYYNIDYLLAGSKGVAQFTIDKVLTKPDDKMIYSLTDRSREAYNFKNADGVMEKDIKGRKLREVVYKNGIKEKAFSIANNMVLENPVKADELRCIEYALEVADLDPSTIRTKEVNDKVEHAYCKELRETAC